MSIVNTNIPYTYSILKKDIHTLLKQYPYLECKIIGNSVLLNNIYCFRIGIGKKTLFYSSSIHANEWITSTLIMKFLEDYCCGLTNNSYDFKFLFDNFTLYIVPMINPDGVNLVNNVYSCDSDIYQFCSNFSSVYPNIHFPSGWKSNINGVDFFNFQYYI